MMWNVTNVTGW